MSNNDKDWFVELGLIRDQEKIIEWGIQKYPHFVKNKNLIAQLWYTQVLGKVLPTPQKIVSIEELRVKAKAFADAGDLKTDTGKDRRVWGSLEVMIVGPLGDGRPYFGCPKCLRSIDKNIGVCINNDEKFGHPDETIEGQNLTWQNWQAGDSTGEVVITFSPNKKQTPQTIQGNVLVISGSLSLRDGRYTVWEIVKNKSAGVSMGSSLKNATPEPEVETVVEEEVPEIGETKTEIVYGGEHDVVAETQETKIEIPAEEEEDIGAEVFEGLGEVGEESTGGIETRIDNYASLVKRFKNSLKRYVGKKIVDKAVMVKWLLIQPELRTDPDDVEKADLFLAAMVDNKIIEIDAEDMLKNLVGG